MDPDAIDDPRCSVTAETLLLDGANGVCRDARLGTRDRVGEQAAAILALAVVIAAFLGISRVARRGRGIALAVLAVAGAVPGAYAVFSARADRPALIATTARTSIRLHDAVREFAIEQRCAEVTLDRCRSCLPSVSLALADLSCDSPASIELHEDALDGECVADGRTLVCGSVPPGAAAGAAAGAVAPGAIAPGVPAAPDAERRGPASVAALIVPFWLAILPLVAAALLGWLIERFLLGGAWAPLGAAAWALRALAGLTGVLAMLLHPVALAVPIAAGLAIRRRRSAPERPRGREPDSVWVATVLVALAVLAVRPPVPLYWDEHVWLAKVRLASLGPLVLRAHALDPIDGVVPAGYPILASLAQSLFALSRADLPSLLGGALALTMLALASACALLPARQRLVWIAALVSIPLLWIHARSAYLDLPIGLLALALASALARSARGDRGGAYAAVMLAFLMPGLKDEGIAHVAAIAVAHVIAASDRRTALREAAAVIFAGGLAMGFWRVLLAVYEVPVSDHTIEGGTLHETLAIGREITRASADLRSWGLGWAIALGAIVAAIARGGIARSIGLAVVLQLVFLALGLAIGSERLRAFALDGTLINRMLIQLVPLAAWCVVEMLEPRAEPARP